MRHLLLLSLIFVLAKCKFQTENAKVQGETNYPKKYACSKEERLEQLRKRNQSLKDTLEIQRLEKENRELQEQVIQGNKNQPTSNSNNVQPTSSPKSESCDVDFGVANSSGWKLAEPVLGSIEQRMSSTVGYTSGPNPGQTISTPAVQTQKLSDCFTVSGSFDTPANVTITYASLSVSRGGSAHVESNLCLPGTSRCSYSFVLNARALNGGSDITSYLNVSLSDKKTYTSKQMRKYSPATNGGLWGLSHSDCSSAMQPSPASPTSGQSLGWPMPSSQSMPYSQPEPSSK